MDQLAFAKQLRRGMTEAETTLWRQLRVHRLVGEKFRRQQPIGPCVVDFVHFGARLIVEADGGQHGITDHDRRRDAWLNAQGFRVLRFWNNDIRSHTDAVLAAVIEAVRKPPSPPDPSPVKGEGSKAPDLCAEVSRDVTPRCAGLRRSARGH